MNPTEPRHKRHRKNSSMVVFVHALLLILLLPSLPKDGSALRAAHHHPPSDGDASSDQIIVEHVEFGSAAIKNMFMLGYTNFNHGSFGACPKPVLQHQDDLRDQQEQKPDPWMRRDYRILVNSTRRDLSHYLGLSKQHFSVHTNNNDDDNGNGNGMHDESENLVLVESASTAVNSVLRSYDWREGDVIAYFSVAYAMVKNTATWLQDVYGVDIVEIPVQFPIADSVGDDAFLAPLEDMLQQLSKVGRIPDLKMIVLDHVSSAPAVLEPIQACSQMVKSFNEKTMVVVDGAHAMGMIPSLRIHDMAPIDVYLSNGHKWLYSPKGSAVLWFNASIVTPLFPEPTVISSANPVPHTPLSERYSYVSVRDYTAFISMSAALSFRSRLGGDDAIHAYCRKLALDAKAFLMDLWHVAVLVPDDMETFMFNIPLPSPFADDFAMASTMAEDLLADHNIYFRPLLEVGSGTVYTRLSSQIYLNMADFRQLGLLVNEYAERLILGRQAAA